MPSSDTFNCQPIGELVRRYLRQSKISVDPFARNKRWATYTNDLNPETEAEYHMDALDFLLMLLEKKIKVDLVIFDPPYSIAQVKECYEGIGLKVMQSDAYRTAAWSKEREVINEILDMNGVVISCGWNSIGMGKFDYQIEDLLLVCHGAAHNDTITIVERKISHQASMFESKAQGWLTQRAGDEGDSPASEPLSNLEVGRVEQALSTLALRA